ncbi:DNA alkylation repair protein [Arthrobacter sp. CDRTa11]|uniref:DNA alkylation repair protein n=1 Tax=Arthrobacter sp. CDRTa11 TaxID=2651199 RepID=UPI0022659642|nr:DNA alkylation repair protein [Arthrobacter sp. CDRTa11]UZX05494.1 DNA alkylation repair protein [Arthrobacter sp. CDRTa11]
MSTAVNGRLLAAIRKILVEHADPVRAAGVQAYMKSAVPSLGVRVPDVRRLTAAAAAECPFDSVEQLRSTVLELWRNAAWREERYAAIDLTGLRIAAGDPLMLPVYEELIRTGAWWDFADGVAHRICDLLQAHRPTMTEVLRSWSRDGDFWIRRASITAQLKAKAATDTELLRDVIEANLADPEFFVRKAIGWSLREYAKTDAEWVRSFVAEHSTEMSPLSRREALRNLEPAVQPK